MRYYTLNKYISRLVAVLLVVTMLMASAPAAFAAEGGCAEELAGRYRYVLTLDADTEYLPGDVRDRISDLCDEVKKILGLHIRHRSLW